MKKYILSLLFLLSGVLLYGQAYVMVNPSSITVPQDGGTFNCNVDYSFSPDSLFTWHMHHYTSPYSEINVSDNGGKRLTVTFPANMTSRPKSGNITLYYPDPYNSSSLLSGNLYFSQQGETPDYSISVSPSSVNIEPQGGYTNLQVAYVHRTEAVTTTYLGATGLPSGCTLSSGNNGTLLLHCPPNKTGSTRYGSVTVRYSNPLDAAYPETATFTMNQSAYAGYWIEISTDRFTVDAGGGSYEYDFAFGPTDSITVMPTPRLGIPVNTQIDQANFRPATRNGEKGTIAFKSNTTGSTINGTVVLEYPDPTDHTHLLTHAISFTQASALPVPQQQSMTERVYTDESGLAYNTTITYYDGLYRQEQTVLVGASPAGGDIVSFVEYDCMGRADSVSYLPFVTSVVSGAKVANPLSEQTAFYTGLFGVGQGNYARSYKVYDHSPLGLVLKQTSPGENYTLSGYYTHFGYRLNTQPDSIRRYRMAGDSSLKFDGYYAPGRLTVKRVLAAKDNATEAEQAQQKESFEYTNAQGQVIAKEVRVSEGKRHMTYYVYDDLGLQRYVLPPPQHATLTDGSIYQPSQVHEFSYYTEYDDKGLPVRQWNPGTNCVYSLYDLRGRLALSQSGRQRENNEWSFTKYDQMDRPVLSGVITGGTYESHKAALDAATELYEVRGTTVHGYTNQSYPSVPTTGDYLTVTYYDDYDWLPAKDPHGFSTVDALGGTPSFNVRGLSTGGKSKVLGVETDQWLTTAIYYDQDCQTIQSVADLYPSGMEITSNIHDFMGNVKRTKVKQIVENMVSEYNKWFEFDSFGRLQQVSQQITGDDANGKVVLASYTYDALGKTSTKLIHNALDVTQYQYDLQGRTIQSVSPTFSWWLGFDQTVAKMTGRYDGNIQAAVWQHAGETKKAFRYTYDGLGQMTSGIYRSMDNGSSWSVKSSFKENIVYKADGSGNIKWISRTDAAGVSTGITLGLTGYQVKDCQVSGQSRTFFDYDVDGNMISDGRRGLTITYNKLNLPEEVIAGDQKVSYIYNASGQKLACNANGSLTYYRSVMVYGNDGKLLYMLHPEGTVICTNGSTGTNYTYNYFKTDHLRSTRAMLSAVDGTLQVSQRTDYYPFGLSFEHNNLNKNKYLFGGKELQDGQLNGSLLGWYDFGARYYDPVLGRWFNTDPAAQLANPYLFCGNSPIMYVDPDGRFFFTALLIGAFLNVGIQAATGQLHSPLDFVRSFSIGMLSGLVGFGAGGAVASVTGSLGFAGAAISGAAGGFEGGFAAGTTTSWANRGGVGDGLKAGLKGAGIGAAAGALIGGIVGGARAAIHGGNFWSGKGATFDLLDTSSSSGTSPEIGEGLEYNNSFAKRFADTFFGPNKRVNNLFADGTLPPGYTMQNGVVKNLDKEAAMASTTYAGGGQSNVYLYPAAFKNEGSLYLSIGHEYVHVNLNAAGYHDPKYRANGEATAHTWQVRQTEALGGIPNEALKGLKSATAAKGVSYGDQYMVPIIDWPTFQSKLSSIWK